MTDHPTPSEIDRLVRGTLSGAGRRRLVTHLLRGCPRCARLLAPAIALTPRTPPPPQADDGYERPVARACAAAVRRFREIRSERDAAGLAEIGLRGLLRVEALLAAAWDLRHHDPEEMVRIAELALVAAERLEKDRYGRAEIADMRVRAWAELANAYRVTEDLLGPSRRWGGRSADCTGEAAIPGCWRASPTSWPRCSPTSAGSRMPASCWARSIASTGGSATTTWPPGR